MPLVKVKQKFQVTIPTEIRDAVPLAVGDMLEVTVQGTNIVLTPKAVIDRAKARERLLEVMDRVHAQQPPSKKSPKPTTPSTITSNGVKQHMATATVPSAALMNDTLDGCCRVLMRV